MEHENWVLLLWAFWLALIGLVLAIGALAWLVGVNNRLREVERRVGIAAPTAIRQPGT